MKFDFLILLFTIVALLSLMLSPEVNKFYFASTLVLYSSLCYVFGPHTFKRWKGFTVYLKIPIALFICLFLVIHIQGFGTKQFGSITRQLGGGEPQQAYLQIDSKCPDLTTFFKLKQPNVMPGTTNCIGPVYILLKGDKEIIFADPANVTSTNKVARQIRSDLVDAILYAK